MYMCICTCHARAHAHVCVYMYVHMRVCACEDTCTCICECNCLCVADLQLNIDWTISMRNACYREPDFPHIGTSTAKTQRLENTTRLQTCLHTTRQRSNAICNPLWHCGRRRSASSALAQFRYQPNITRVVKLNTNKICCAGCVSFPI